MEHVTIKRTDSANTDFRMLVEHLDRELQLRDGDASTFYAQFNKIDLIRQVVVLYNGTNPAACGAFKPFEDKSVEIKRMFVLESERRKGFASAVLSGLEKWAMELGNVSAVLETGQNQPEAIGMYHKYGYQDIPNYGQYIGVENSVCMKKNLLQPAES